MFKKEQVRRYDKQGSAYAIRINREAIHRKDSRRGSARKGGKKERRGEGKEGVHEVGSTHDLRHVHADMLQVTNLQSHSISFLHYIIH